MVQARKIYVQHRIVEAHGFSSAGNGGFLSHGGSRSYHGCFNTNTQMLETYQLHLRGACCTSTVHGLILTCTIPCTIPCVWALLRFRFQDVFWWSTFFGAKICRWPTAVEAGNDVAQRMLNEGGTGVFRIRERLGGILVKIEVCKVQHITCR